MEIVIVHIEEKRFKTVLNLLYSDSIEFSFQIRS